MTTAIDIGDDAPATFFLVVEQSPADVVSYPDGTSEVVRGGRGEIHAHDWNDRHMPDMARAAEERWRAEEDARRARWEADQRTEAPPSADSDKAAAAARRFDEAVAEWEARRDQAPTTDLISKLAWDRENPKPTLEQVYLETHGEPLPHPAEPGAYVPEPKPSPPRGATVKTLGAAWWARSAGLGTEFRTLLAREGAMPLTGVARLLADLHGKGWVIAHVAEKRAVVHHHDRSETVEQGASYLLQRAS